MKAISNKRAAKKKALMLAAETKCDPLEKEVLYEVCAQSMFNEIYSRHREEFNFFLSRRFKYR
ncbi:MAG: hypothetical protein K2X02_08155 [Alphaproteobacteria bacterium]|nr:hypothetical protein [Alphaproteobacteria bacterium]